VSIRPVAFVRLFAVCVTIICVLVTAGCSGGRTNRVDLDTEDLGDTGTGSKELRAVCQKMVRSLIQLHQIQTAKKPPRIALVRVENRSNEMIDTKLFTRKMRTQLIKYARGRVIFVDRSRMASAAIQRERQAKRTAVVSSRGSKMLSGADYFLTGEIGSIDKARAGKRSTYTRYAFRLTDAESSDILWEDEYEMKKVARTGMWDQ